jgi:hypothetical protein
MEILVYGLGEGFSSQTLNIEENDIQEFAIVNRKSYTTKGTFKKFTKIFKVKLANEWYQLSGRDSSLVNDIVKKHKNNYTVQKYTESVYKNGNERKATDWYYRKIV